MVRVVCTSRQRRDWYYGPISTADTKNPLQGRQNLGISEVDKAIITYIPTEI